MSRPEPETTPSEPARHGMIHWTDTLIALVIFGVCVFLYRKTDDFEEASALLGDSMSPDTFPKMMIWVIAGLAVLLPFEHLFNRDGIGRLDRSRSERIGLMALLTGAFLVLVVLSIQVVGTLGSMVLVALGLPLLWAERRFGLLVPFAIIFPALVTLLFAYILGVHFEPGALGIRVR